MNSQITHEFDFIAKIQGYVRPCGKIKIRRCLFEVEESRMVNYLSVLASAQPMEAPIKANEVTLLTKGDGVVKYIFLSDGTRFD